MLPIIACLAGVGFVVADATTPPPEIDWLTRAGVVGVMAFFLWAFLTNRIISGGTHRRVVDERDRLLELAITNAHVASRSVEIAEQGTAAK